MKVKSDFIYVTQQNGKTLLWLDEPVKRNNVWVGKQPYVDSVMHDTVVALIGDRKLDEPEMIVLEHE